MIDPADDWLELIADEESAAIPELATIEPDSQMPLFPREREIQFCLQEIDRVHADGGQFCRLHFTVGPDVGYFSDVVIPLARALAKGRCLAVVDFETCATVPDEIFPIFWLTGDQLTKQRMKSLIRTESPAPLATLLKDRNRNMLFFLSLLERTPEPVHPHLRSLIDGYYRDEGDPCSRKESTHVLIQVDWHLRDEAGIKNVLDAGVIGRVSGVCGIEPRKSPQ